MKKPEYADFPPAKLIPVAHQAFLAWKNVKAAKFINPETIRYSSYLNMLLYKNLNCRITSPQEKEQTSIELIQTYWQMQEHLERIIYIVNECYPHSPKGLKLLSKFNVLEKNINVWPEHINVMDIIRRPDNFTERCIVINNIINVLSNDPLLFIQVSDNNGLLSFWQQARKNQLRARRRLALGFSSDFYREVGKFLSLLYDQIHEASRQNDLCSETSLTQAGFFL